MREESASISVGEESRKRRVFLDGISQMIGSTSTDGLTNERKAKISSQDHKTHLPSVFVEQEAISSWMLIYLC